MTDDIYVYLVDMPERTHEMVVPCFGGYTIYINEKMDKEHQIQSYRHALRHIKKGDFERTESATLIEFHTHKED